VRGAGSGARGPGGAQASATDVKAGRSSVQTADVPRPAEVRKPHQAVLSLDFTRPAAAAVLAVVYLLSRLPWITLGYGADPDGARVAVSADYLWRHGQYYPSRLPGYPLFELTEAALYPFGATVMNAATLVVSFAGVLLFAAVVNRLRIEPKGLLTVTFAFGPMVWINSSITLDYLWAVTFILAAYLVLCANAECGMRNAELGTGRTGHSALAGVLFGIAIGCRPTAALFALPFFVLLARGRQPRPLLVFFVAAGLTAFVAFLPITLRYGTAFLNFFDVRPAWKKVARTLAVEAFGLTTAIGLTIVAAISWRRLLELPLRLRRDVHLAFAVLAILLMLLSFMRLPLEEAYLVPALPFLLIGAARLLRRPAVIAVCLLVLMGGLLDFHSLSTQGWRDPVAALAGIRPVEGRVLVDYELRRHRLHVAQQMRTLDLPEHSVVTAGFYYPIFLAQYPNELELRLPRGFRTDLIGPLTDLSEARDDRGVTYVWLMRPGDARKYRAAGYRTFTMDLDGKDVLVTFETYLPEHERFAVR
jgi:hypothetical protein